MYFLELKTKMQKHFHQMIENQENMFQIDVDKEELWNIYLDSFPEGKNEIFRKRREFDCSCCRHFMRQLGNVVAINPDYSVTTIWNFDSGEFQPVTSALSKYLQSQITNVFISNIKKIGTNFNFEELSNGEVIQWDHFYLELPDRFISKESVGSFQGKYRDVKNVFKRSLEEISRDAVETILDLISQKSLYKGEEWEPVLNKFLSLQKTYHELDSRLMDNFCWVESIRAGGGVSKIRNHSIGVLLNDLSGGIDINKAVKRYENIVAPANYKRPKAIFTKKMVEQAEEKIKELGLLNSLSRRFATIDDISINSILFANKEVKEEKNVFDDLQKGIPVNPKKFDKIQEIPIDKFIEDILPNINKIEVLLENKHVSNFVSLIAPENRGSNSMFKWGNGFSWAYKDNVTDSMKQRVKSMGGDVEGVLRFSIQWNENGDDNNDLDAHCHEPDGNIIFYRKKGRTQRSSGILDVDIVEPANQIGNDVAVENITYSKIERMPRGDYSFLVHCYAYRGGNEGFNAEIEFDDQIYEYSYPKELRHNQKIKVATVNWDGERFKIVKSLSSQSKNIWGVDTNQFHPVSVVMLSPNYWESSVGHRHVFFMLKDCINDQRPNGFFNEFLKEDFMPHKKVFEALGSKMRVETSKNQLSGIGFSTTKQNNLTVKVSGNFTRTLKLTF